MQDGLGFELQSLISQERITTLLQPIVDTAEGVVYGYEALSRGPSDSPLHAAPMLFETAERCNLTRELETLCLRTAASTWAGHGVPQKLFVNVSPDMLLPPRFETARLVALLTANRLSPSDIVIELSERYPTTDLAGLQKSLQWLKSRGFIIAIDDLGSGYSGLKLWSELKPDFVKIDRHFVRDIQDDLVKREFVRSVVDLSERLGCRLIAEGVETAAELKLISELGITLVQGFLFGRPKAIPTASLEALLPAPWRAPQRLTQEAALSLCEPVAAIAPDATLNEAWQRLHREPHLFALPVVEAGRPLGLLHKWRILETFSTPYGRALNEKREVLHLLSSDALVVEHTMSLEDISQRLIEEDLHYLKQHFIITEEGRYLGLGATRSLLQQITAQKIEKARYANPLTLLPGNVPIQQALEAQVNLAGGFTLIYFDINNFKPLNDVLGYRTGDRVILNLAEALVSEFPARSDFVGHIGGDDFVVITRNEDPAAVCERIQHGFALSAQACYPADMQAAGFVESTGRDGHHGRFPLVSLSAGLVRVGPGDRRTADQLADTASYAKTRAKASPEYRFTQSVAAA
ncbi:MAG: GGDEF domain-containing protein [Marinobacter sp.]|uniref:phosphodiesterase n=1 Tax=Marinobacter sp. TaxID=50741 RepID=UPI00299D403C|nr:GGDEF domain-containing protein [Marinobacter sp.]MDX1633588.1 GGDEF domain-containing protein [Marinobacter sp.]